MKKRKFYLDTCIILEFYYEKDRTHKKVVDFFKRIYKLKNITLCISDFCLTELAKVYPNQNKVEEAKIKKYGLDYKQT